MREDDIHTAESALTNGGGGDRTTTDKALNDGDGSGSSAELAINRDVEEEAWFFISSSELIQEIIVSCKCLVSSLNEYLNVIKP